MANPQLNPTSSPESTTVYGKLIIVAGGSFGSPLILERSGIGASSVLEKFGVEQVVDLPGVGERYQGEDMVCNLALVHILKWFCVDHQVIVPVCHASEDSDTIDGLLSGDPDEVESEFVFRFGLVWICCHSCVVSS